MTRASRRTMQLMLLAVFMIGAGLGLRPLSNVDEERFLGVALEMLESGEWLIPHRAGEIYADKPPLFVWAVALLVYLGIPAGIALFLPALLAATVATGLLCDLGGRLWNRRIGTLAGLLFLATYQTYSIQRAGQIDGFLLLWIALGLYGMCRHLILGPAWRWFYLACLAMGFGVISKGVGFLPALLLIPWAYAVRQGWSGVTTIRASARAWLTGPLLMLAAIASWLVPLLASVALDDQAQGRAYLSNILFKQTAQRYTDAWHHREPIWYFFVQVIPQYWLPLVLMLPWAVGAWRRHLAKRDGRYLVLLGWVVLVLLFFSLSSGKRKLYIYPALPALILAIAPLMPWLLRRWFAQRERHGNWARTVTVLWFTAWFARGFIEPLVEGGNERQALMKEVAALSRGSELVLTHWREGHWLYARQPLVHFGMEAPDQTEKAVEWLRANPDSHALISTSELDRCFWPEAATPLSDPERYLVKADADNGKCHSKDVETLVYRFTWSTPLD
ncbi:ArnT family glycosyltransferase [Pseudomonas sp. CCOS 191]|uniref:ArnT family glycosyltransferase n=1 Tax=Pseudomonas sp. CCOS 191 TaxID=1649877 RepID=UPI000624BA03|nr:glycosyltransferase family 39 protein [Pseudomonas sp. CCOS 191]CRI55272.1 Polymyxin resistance protein ArnT, undecaprenyl phosphate-alpha-L-Ara4N transferase [Pseudomonas sp. CCOS 191]